MIKFRKSICDISKYQTGNLPTNAEKMDSPSSTADMIKKTAPIAVILCVLIIMAMFIKTITARTVIVFPPVILVGFVLGYFLLIVHEWLHAIVYPKEAEVTIGKLKGKIVFVALCSYPLKRSRFILMSLLPFVLGIIPLLLFLFSPPQWTIYNSVMYGMACMGMVSPYPDVYNVILVMKQSNKGDKIMLYGDDIYRIS